MIVLLAGVVKVVSGMGLPAVAMGLLASIMTPLAAAALIVVPSLLTNVRQLFDGRVLGALVNRFQLMPILTFVSALAEFGPMVSLDPAIIARPGRDPDRLCGLGPAVAPGRDRAAKGAVHLGCIGRADRSADRSTAFLAMWFASLDTLVSPGQCAPCGLNPNREHYCVNHLRWRCFIRSLSRKK